MGLREYGVAGETVGETLVFGVQQLLGRMTTAEREAYVRTHAPILDVQLDQFGRVLGEMAEPFAELYLEMWGARGLASGGLVLMTS